MDVPIEIKTAVKDLADFMGSRLGNRTKEEVHDEALRLLHTIWGVREQIPTPEQRSVNDYFTRDELEFANVALDYQTEQEVLWGGRLIGHALDRRFNRLNVWQYHINQEQVDTSWVELLVDRVIKRLQLTPQSLKRLGVSNRKFKPIVELELAPLRGGQVLEEEVEDLTPDQKQILADLMKYQGLPDSTTGEILECLYTDITHVTAPEFAQLGAVCGLFYAVWLRLKRM